jgi:hypothetical protein
MMNRKLQTKNPDHQCINHSTLLHFLSSRVVVYTLIHSSPNTCSNTLTICMVTKIQDFLYISISLLSWNSFALKKCKIFAWLTLHNRLNMKERLLRRGVVTGSTCPFGCQADEDHMFFLCPHTSFL